MSELEFILIGVSMVLAIALGKLLEGVVDISGDPSRYWVHSGWVLSRLMGVVLYFWVFRAAVIGQMGIEWTFGKFFLAMGGPVTTFMQAHLLLAIDRNVSKDWRSHFYSVRRRFFLFAIVQQAVNIENSITFDIPASAPAFLLLMVLSIAGIVWSNPRLHAFIVCVYLAIQTAGLALPIIEDISLGNNPPEASISEPASSTRVPTQTTGDND
jgi:hypothetical protein